MRLSSLYVGITIEIDDIVSQLECPRLYEAGGASRSIKTLVWHFPDIPDGRVDRAVGT